MVFSLSSLVVSLQVVVIIVIWIISLLVIYMLFLVCLDPLLNKKTTQYQEQTNEEVSRSTFPLPFFPILCPILFSCSDRNSTKKIEPINNDAFPTDDIIKHVSGGGWCQCSALASQRDGRPQPCLTHTGQVETPGPGTTTSYLRSSYHSQLKNDQCIFLRVLYYFLPTLLFYFESVCRINM